MKSILIVGGAGYIGSHVVKAVAKAGYHPVALDNLSTGHPDAVQHGQLIVGSMADNALLDQLFREHDIAAVMHYATIGQAGESVRDPASYYRNNLAATRVLLDAMHAHGIKRLVFSSTAAVYGNPQYLPVDEEHRKLPINPYGRTMWMVEQMLADYDTAYDLRYVSLRNFNVAGADGDGELGERHIPENHLIPLVLQAGLGKSEAVTVFGTDYETRDGTCVRDYVHIDDLCNAHLAALQVLLKGAPSTAYNIGNGEGFTVKEVIGVAEHVLQRSIPVVQSGRRAGDPASLIADTGRARAELEWAPRHRKLGQIVQYAALWEIRHYLGYADTRDKAGADAGLKTVSS